MQRLAVSGASGKTGWRLMEEALARGLSVRAIVRPESLVPPAWAAAERDQRLQVHRPRQCAKQGVHAERALGQMRRKARRKAPARLVFRTRSSRCGRGQHRRQCRRRSWRRPERGREDGALNALEREMGRRNRPSGQREVRTSADIITLCAQHQRPGIHRKHRWRHGRRRPQ